MWGTLRGRLTTFFLFFLSWVKCIQLWLTCRSEDVTEHLYRKCSSMCFKQCFRVVGLFPTTSNISGESQNFIESLPSSQSYSRNKIFLSTKKNRLKNRNCTFLVVRYFKWKLEFVSNIFWIIASENSFLFLTHLRPFQIWFAWLFL